MHYLFIGHSAKGTGSPRSFLTIIDSIKSIDRNFSCEIILIRDGPLKYEYSQLGPVTVVQKSHRPSFINKIIYFIQKILYDI